MPVPLELKPQDKYCASDTFGYGIERKGAKQCPVMRLREEIISSKFAPVPRLISFLPSQ
jgi:hypothetical protein